MSLRGNQAPAEQAFGFLGSLTNRLACGASGEALKERICELLESKHPAKQDKECEARGCECTEKKLLERHGDYL